MLCVHSNKDSECIFKILYKKYSCFVMQIRNTGRFNDKNQENSMSGMPTIIISVVKNVSPYYIFLIRLVKGKPYGGRKNDIYTRQDVYLPAIISRGRNIFVL